MRYGSRNPHDMRTRNDLGRFGLGMKMASLSQRKKVIVMSKREENIAVACGIWIILFRQGKGLLY